MLDQDVSIPAVTGVLGQRDVAALNEIGNHLKVIGAAPWSGMQGTGQITYGIADPMSYSATLSILGSTGFRLDAQTAKGLLSIRIHGRYGVIQDGNGSQSFLFPSTAATGIFQFEMPRLVTFPDPTASLYDHGLGPVGGSILHRITLEYPLNPKAVGLQVRETVATDFYFDPTSHLLLKSANAIRISGAGQSTFLRVITYEDYRQVSGSMIPFRYTQTLNGQKEWTLQLSDVQLNANFNPSIFEF